MAIINAIVNKQSSLYLGSVSKIGRWLFAVFPGIYVKVMTKQAKEKFE